MKKIIFFLIIFLIFCNKSFSNTNASSESISPFCENKINQKYVENFDKLRIKKIEIDNNNYRKWTVNGIRIITNKFRFTPEKYKKRFNAKILMKITFSAYLKEELDIAATLKIIYVYRVTQLFKV